MSIEDDAKMYKMQQDAAAYTPTAAQQPAETAPLESNVPSLKYKPNFLQSMGDIATGVDRGVSNFALALLSKVPLGDKWQNALKTVDKQNEEAQQRNIAMHTGILPQVGQVIGETLATAPLGAVAGALGRGAVAAGEAAQGIKGLATAGKVLSTIGQGPAAIGAAMPTGLGTIAKYGASALGGMGLLAGMESQRYDPEHPGQLINEKAAGEALSNPYAAILPMAATKLGTWANAADRLAAAKEIDPNAMARNILPNDSTRTLSNMFFGIPAAVTGMGKQAQQMRDIGQPVSAFVQTLAKTDAPLTADKLTEYSANIMQSTLKKLGRAEDKLWNKGFKSVAVSNVQGVKDDVINAIDLLQTNKIPGYETVSNYLKNGIRTNNMKVEDVKKLQGLISGAAINANELEGGIGNQLANDLGKVKDSLLNHIQNSLSPAEMSDFSAARQFSADKFALFRQAPLLQRALNDEASAHKLINTLTSEGGVLPPKRAAMGILSPGGQDMVAATKIQQALESADTAGRINLDSFLKATSPYTQTGEILNKDVYKSLQGLNSYLKNVDEAAKVGWWRQAAIGGSVGTAALGAGGITAGLPGAAAALASYGAVNFVANHSPVKTLFSALTKNIPQSTRDLITKTIGRHLTRAGFLMSEDGVLKHKSDINIPQQEQQ